MGEDIRAAGAVVWRHGVGGVEVCLVHRPRYGDWTIPKGKLDPGEDFPTAAVREVEEETGYVGVLGRELGEIRYRVDKPGQRGTKVVRYWTMEVAGGSFTPSGEVDEVAWLSPHAAARRLTYPRDREVLARFCATVGR